jgi:hypothetical protein
MARASLPSSTSFGPGGPRYRQPSHRHRGSGNPDHGRERRAIRVSVAIRGWVEQEKAKEILRVVAPVEVVDGDKWARFDPFNGFKLDFTIDFRIRSSDRKPPRDHRFRRAFVRQGVARARTFGFMQDVEALRAAGLILGGSLQNAVVLDDYRFSTPRAALRQRIRQAQVLDASAISTCSVIR